MGLFSDMAEGFFDGFLRSVAENGLPRLGGQARGRIDRLCGELGWAVDERGDDFVRLHFRDATGGLRVVSVCQGDGALVRFIASSNASLRSVPPRLAEYLVTRHADLPFGAWTVTRQNDAAAFALVYNALGGGLTADTFKAVCEALVREAVDFDGRLRGAGLVT